MVLTLRVFLSDRITIGTCKVEFSVLPNIGRIHYPDISLNIIANVEAHVLFARIIINPL